MPKITVRLIIRSQYSYTAHLTPRGKLRYITAGCREWATFDDAVRHYAAERTEAYRWSNEYRNKLIEYVMTSFRGFRDDYRLDDYAQVYAYRLESVSALDILHRKVEDFQGGLARARRKAKAKKTTKRR